MRVWTFALYLALLFAVESGTSFEHIPATDFAHQCCLGLRLQMHGNRDEPMQVACTRSNLQLRGGLDMRSAFFDDSLSHGPSEVEIIEQLADQEDGGNKTWRRTQLERIQKGLFRKIRGTPGLGRPPPGLFPDLESEEEVQEDTPYGVRGPRRSWKEIRGEDEESLQDGQTIREGNLSEHTHPYRYKEEYDTTPPGNTLYIRNLREKVGPARMRQLLYLVFSKFGVLLDVAMLRSKKMRGQAFVCFQDLACAVRAKEELDGFSFLNRTLVIQFARTQSYALHKAQGTFQLMVEQRRNEFLQERAEQEQAEVVQQEEDMRELARVAIKTSGTRAASTVPVLHEMGVHRTEKPSTLLLVESVPDGIREQTGDMAEAYQDLVDVFGQFDGLLRLAPIPNLERVFLAEYESHDAAAAGQQALDGFSYPEFPRQPLSVSYAHAADAERAWEAIERAASAE